MPEFITPIVGSRYHKDAIKRLSRMPVGAPVTLRREPDNPYDSRAVAVFSAGDAGVHLGYVPRDRAAQLASAMDAGAQMRAILVQEIIADQAGEVRFAPKISVRW